jgi:hypothetical protein
MLDSGPSRSLPRSPQILRRWSQRNVELMTQKEVLNVKPVTQFEQIRDKSSRPSQRAVRRVWPRAVREVIDSAMRNTPPR